MQQSQINCADGVDKNRACMQATITRSDEDEELGCCAKQMSLSRCEVQHTVDVFGS